MKKFLITLILSVCAVSAFADTFTFKTTALTTLDKGSRTMLGAQVNVFEKGNLGVGGFFGYDTKVLTNVFSGPFQKDWFKDNPMRVGAVASYRIWTFKSLDVSVTGGYVGSCKKIEAPRDNQWVAGVSFGFRF